MYSSSSDDQLIAQLEYYFSQDNLVQDHYLRSQMDDEVRRSFDQRGLLSSVIYSVSLAVSVIELIQLVSPAFFFTMKRRYHRKAGRCFEF